MLERDVSLTPAGAADASLLANLLELYIHDLSAVFPNVRLGPDGRFGYPKLPLYWSEPERRFPFLIHADGELAGFALATRGSPFSDDPAVLDVAEFFVLRRHRRAGVGQRAACLLWQTLPGAWIVRVSEGNTGALDFWRRTVGEFAPDAVESVRPGEPRAWRTLAFTSKTR
jgi:predicted acetyltransferase